MKRFWTRCATFVFIFLIGTASLYADAIPTVYSTGVNDNGTPLSDLSQDMHYQIIAAPDGAGTTANSYVVDSTKFPLASAWMDNDGTSKWIAPQADQSTFLNETSSGFYTYRLTFDLTGYDETTAEIVGRWTTDNFGEDILLNGVSLGITHASEPPSTFTYFTDFEITSGFVSGVNILDFVVDNRLLDYNGEYNPTGLRVELAGTANAVPEPSTCLLLISSILGLGFSCILRRRKR